MGCDCDSVCPKAKECGCMWIVSSGTCTCTCGPPIVLEPAALAEEIELSTRDLSLGELADLFRQVTGSEILVPVSRLRETFTVSRKDTTIKKQLKEFGLVATGAKPEGLGGYAA
jgi:hypothetical protein